MAAYRKKRKTDELVFSAFGYILLGLFALVCCIPFYLVLVNSFVDEGSIFRKGYSYFIRDFSLTGYQMILKNPETILTSYGVTAFVTVTGTVLSLLLNTMTGFVLSRRDFYWRNPISFFFFFTTLFNGGLVPWYLKPSLLLLQPVLWFFCWFPAAEGINKIPPALQTNSKVKAVCIQATICQSR
ncbi:hypothetical protein FACS1894151_01950 [Spirochaetia bacterium]|nr:hypothetical protein FACS1894151_01950 [Spirochaetia bacterium]